VRLEVDGSSAQPHDPAAARATQSGPVARPREVSFPGRWDGVDDDAAASAAGPCGAESKLVWGEPLGECGCGVLRWNHHPGREVGSAVLLLLLSYAPVQLGEQHLAFSGLPYCGSGLDIRKR